MRILTIQHAFDVPAGLVGQAIVARGGSFDVFQPHDLYASSSPAKKTPMPGSPDGYDGLLILGGPMDAFDDAGFPYFQPLLKLVRAFDDAAKPVMGLCLGSQLIARAFGAEVYRMPAPELGFPALEKTPAAAGDALVRQLPASPRIMQWHQDTFDLPDGATLLLTGTQCRNQLFRIGQRVYAFQGHIEATADIVRGWVHDDIAKGVTRPEGFYERLEVEMQQHLAQAMAQGLAVSDAWLDLVEERAAKAAA